MAPAPAGLDPANTTLFIGGLSTTVSEEQLRSVFARFGDLVYTKVPQGKGCGFVQFVDRRAAEHAMQTMNGQAVGSNPIRISWGRSTNKSTSHQHQQGPSHQMTAGGQYGGQYQQGYAGYGAPYDHNAAAAYPGYAAYDPYAAGAYHGQAAGYAQAYGYGANPAATTGYDAQGQPYSVPAAASATPVASTRPDAKGPSVEDLNAAYMQQHLPQLTGAYMRVLAR